MIIDIQKRYRTGRGQEVKFYDRTHHNIHGAIKSNSNDGVGLWHVHEWDLEGHSRLDVSGKYQADFDLVEVKEKINRKIWLLVMKDGNVAAVNKQEHYDGIRSGPLENFVAIIPIEFSYTEGEGL
jgi:hypothetical protein